MTLSIAMAIAFVTIQTESLGVYIVKVVNVNTLEFVLLLRIRPVVGVVGVQQTKSGQGRCVTSVMQVTTAKKIAEEIV